MAVLVLVHATPTAVPAALFTESTALSSFPGPAAARKPWAQNTSMADPLAPAMIAACLRMKTLEPCGG